MWKFDVSIIKSKLYDSDMNQGELAKELKMDSATISRIINTNNAKINTLTKIAERLKFDVINYLVFDSSNRSGHVRRKEVLEDVMQINRELQKRLNEKENEIVLLKEHVNTQSKYIKILEKVNPKSTNTG